MHLGDVFAGHGFDDEAAVVGGQEAAAEAALRVAVERGAPGQGVLGRRAQARSAGQARGLPNGRSAPHLIVLVVDTKALPQVAEHHGTVLLKLEATGQVFPGNKDAAESLVSQEKTRKSRFPRGLNLRLKRESRLGVKATAKRDRFCRFENKEKNPDAFVGIIHASRDTSDLFCARIAMYLLVK